MKLKIIFRIPQMRVRCWLHSNTSGFSMDLSGIKIPLTCHLATEKPYKIIVTLTVLAYTFNKGS